MANPDMVSEGALVNRPKEVNPLLCQLLAGQGVLESAPGGPSQGLETEISLKAVPCPLPLRSTMR